MKLYQKLAEKCEIEKNSKVYIPDEALKFFVRLVITDYHLIQNNGYMNLGYTSGLFDGSGNVCAKSIENYYKEIHKTIKEINDRPTDETFNHIKLDNHFGVEMDYVPKNNHINKPKM